MKRAIEGDVQVAPRFGEKTGLLARDELHAHDATYPPGNVTLGTPGALATDPDTAVTLDGLDKIFVPASLDFAPAASFSVEVWAKIAAGAPGLAFILDHEDFSSTRGGWDLILNGSGVIFERWSTDGHVSVGTPAMTPGIWHHLVGTYSASEASATFIERIWLDGALAQTGYGEGRIPAVAGGWSIGGQNCECQAGYAGALDELAVYDFVLSPGQISAHFRAANP